MPVISGFRATHYAPGTDLASVTAPPYDVIAPDERDSLAALDLYNIVHLTLNKQLETDTPENSRYTRAAFALKDWRESGVLVTDTSPHMFLYRLDFEEDGEAKSVAGLVAALMLEELGAGGVYGHERTIAGPKADRLSLLRSTRANLEPLWFFASAPIEGFAELIEGVSAREASAEVTDPQEIRHRVWAMSESEESDLRDQISNIPLVIADGHHRYETSLAYRDEQRAERGHGPWDSTLALITDPVEFAPPVHAIHRLVKELAPSEIGGRQPFDGDVRSLARSVADSGPGMIGVAHREGCWTIESSGEIDTVWLADNLLEPSGRPVRYEHDLRIVEERIAEKGETAFVMAPTPVEVVARKALEGVRLPPKTTLFSPKPRSGLLLRTFD